MVWGQGQNESGYRSGHMSNMGGGGMSGGMGMVGRGILGESPGTSGMGMGGFGGMMGSSGGGGDNFETIIQQRRLQQQLNLRESQLALASNLLQKQNQLMMDVGYTGPGPNMGPMMPMGGPGDMSRPMIPSLLDMPQGRQGKRMVPMGREPDIKRRRRRSSSPSSMQRDRGHNFDRRSDNRDRFSPGRRHDDDGRARPGRYSRWDSDDRRRTRTNSEEYDPANPTGDDMPGLEPADRMGGRQTRSSAFFCHACDIQCTSDKNFRAHMNGIRHKERMDDILTIHEQKSMQISDRMKAQEHLKRIETTKSVVGFCKLCDQELIIPFNIHKGTIVHKKREMQVRKGCGWCGVKDFQNFSQVLRHRETQKHKQNAQKFGKKVDGEDFERTERRSPPRMSSREAYLKSRRPTSRPYASKGTSSRFSATKLSSSSKSKETAEDPMPELKFKKEVSIGQNYVIPVSGFFCKLCHKFYNTENAAKVTHCQSEQHFNMYKKAKVAARAKAKALKAKPTSTSTPKGDASEKPGESGEANNTMAELNRADDEQDKEDGEEKMDDKGEEEETEHNQEDQEAAADNEVDETHDDQEQEQIDTSEVVDQTEASAGQEEQDSDLPKDEGGVQEEGEDAEGTKDEEEEEAHNLSGEILDLASEMTEEEEEKLLLKKEDGESDVGDAEPEEVIAGPETDMSETASPARGRGRGRSRRGKRGKK